MARNLVPVGSIWFLVQFGRGQTCYLPSYIEYMRYVIPYCEYLIFSTSVGVSQQLTAFKSYRTVEKPDKFKEKGNLEVLLHSIQSKMRANNQKPFTPKEGKLVSDINKVWCLSASTFVRDTEYVSGLSGGLIVGSAIEVIVVVVFLRLL